MSRKYLLLVSGCILLAGLLLGGCGSSAGPQQAGPKLLTIGYNRWAGYGPLYIADKKGFFTAEGVSVQTIAFGTYEAEVGSLNSGQMDGAALVLTDATRLAAEKPLQIVWGFDTSAGGDGVVATASIKSLADLKGKRVGYLPGSFGHLFVAKMLESAGLTEADIIPVKLGGSEEVPSALKTGQIDAGFTSDPFLTQAVDEGAVKLLTSADLPGVIVDVLAFQSQVVEQNPQQIRAITRALAKAMDYWEHNPEEGNSIVANAIGATAEDVPAMLPGVRTYTLKDNQVAFDRSTVDPLSLYAGSSATADFLLKQGIIKQALNLDTFINPSFVQAVSGG